MGEKWKGLFLKIVERDVDKGGVDSESVPLSLLVMGYERVVHQWRVCRPSTAYSPFVWAVYGCMVVGCDGFCTWLEGCT